MANNCWNYVTISGDKNVLDEIQERFSKYDDFNYFVEFGDYVLKKENKISIEDYYHYGTKWWEIHMERSEDNCLIISGDSAWSPPLELMTELSKVFPVVIEGEYNECGMDFGGFFSAYEGGLDDNQMTYREYQLECDRDWAIQDIIDCLESFEEEFNEEDYDYLTQEEKEYIKKQLKK
jgi:hypothetical protein